MEKPKFRKTVVKPGTDAKADQTVETGAVDMATEESDDGATQVHVNVEEEPRRGRIASWIVTGMGAISALAAAAATASVGLNSANTSNALEDLASNSEEQAQMQLNLAHQEQVLPVRLTAEKVDVEAPEGFEVIEVTVANPGEAMLMGARIQLPGDAVALDGTGGEDLVRTNVINADVVVDEFVARAFVPSGADADDSIAAGFTTSWDPRERWVIAPLTAPTLTSCVYGGDVAAGGGDNGGTEEASGQEVSGQEVKVGDVSDIGERMWVGCDAVYDDAFGEGGLAGLADLDDMGDMGDIADAAKQLGTEDEEPVTRSRYSGSVIEMQPPKTEPLNDEDAEKFRPFIESLQL
ncbi:hypothetical protein [Corynebacterium sp. Marseille-P4321]|uniref:hypothetical protein n=1 Tax=Corynebacterium sp. Marseille-P4321 TaxID=2736603 RepID=UPI00158C5466|nr:hypothetical protein [Corynebacterium sp. Marseille-P4321]